MTQCHPNANIWVCPQDWQPADYARWVALASQPATREWLAGTVYGPGMVVPLATFKNDTYPVTYPVRLYPDITHSLSCQLPVPNWDPVLAWAENREPVNPRVTQELSIAWSQKAAADAGMSSYNEGTHDDVNKHVWLAAFWGCDDGSVDGGGAGCDKDQLLDRTLHDYARLYFGAHLEDAIVAGIRGLEQDWIGRLVDNPTVNETFATFATVQQLMMPRDRWNWRIQQLLYRANYDKGAAGPG